MHIFRIKISFCRSRIDVPVCAIILRTFCTTIHNFTDNNVYKIRRTYTLYTYDIMHYFIVMYVCITYERLKENDELLRLIIYLFFFCRVCTFRVIFVDASIRRIHVFVCGVLIHYYYYCCSG